MTHFLDGGFWPLLTVVFGLGVAAITALFARRRVGDGSVEDRDAVAAAVTAISDAMVDVTGTVAVLLDPLQNRIADLEGLVEGLRSRATADERRIEGLVARAQVDEAKIRGLVSLLAELRLYVAALHDHIVSLGGAPPDPPPAILDVLNGGGSSLDAQ